jgi:hypothetical protein
MAGTKHNRLGAGCLALFALPFAAVGLGALGWAGYTLLTWQRMSGWEAVPAQIQSVALEEHSDDDGTTYETVATYSYSYGGRDYTSDRVSVYSGADNVGDFQQRLFDELSTAQARGAPVTAFVDPAAPASATLNRELRWLMLTLQGVFGLVFGGVGFGLLFGSRYAAKKLAAEQVEQARYPDEPWRWRGDWASGRIESSNRGGTIGITAFAVLWNLISLPVLLFVPGEIADGNHIAAVALLFPLVGAGLAAWAVRAWWQLRRFKVATLALQRTPVALGGRLRGSIRVPAAVPVTTSFQLSLSCSQTTERRSGSKRETSERLLWQTDWSVARHQCQMGAAFTAIPVDVAIPVDQPPTSQDGGGSGAVTWRLDIYGECPGPDFSSRFELPVFADATALADNDAAPQDPTPLAAPSTATLAALGIERALAPNGGETWTFRRARHKRIALLTTMFALVWTAATAGIFFSDAPRLIAFVFAGFAVLLGWGVLSLWFTEYRVTLDRGLVTIRRSGLWQGTPVEIPLAWVRRIRAVRGMQFGQKLFFDLKIEANDRTHTAASSVGDYSVASWIAEQWQARGAPSAASAPSGSA